jgi:hypothetical protein
MTKLSPTTQPGNTKGRTDAESHNTMMLRHNTHHDGDEFQCANQWLQAMQVATVGCLHLNQYTSEPQTLDKRYLDATLDYLAHLEEVLVKSQPKHKWTNPPTMDPPPFSSFWEGCIPCTHTIPQSPMVSSKNPYEVFWDADDFDDPDDESGKTKSLTSKDEDEGGDTIVDDYLNHTTDINVDSNNTELDTLRLIIRLHTFQADVEACQATFLATRFKEWEQGAVALQKALLYTQKALDLADSQISQWCKSMEKDTLGMPQDRVLFFANSSGTADHDYLRGKLLLYEKRHRQLMEDANIVHVGIQSLLDKRNAYMLHAQRDIQRLKLKLQRRAEARAMAKQRMGETRWKSNPKANKLHVFQHISDQEQLEKLEKALNMLSMDDTRSLKADRDRVMARLKATQKNHRYNGTRPKSMTYRVEGFPDATEYGWRFTGSALDAVEYFEKPMGDGTTVKLDFLFRSGAVGTVLYDPQRGVSELRSLQKVTKAEYMQTLQDPLACRVVSPNGKTRKGMKYTGHRKQ